MLLRHCFVPSAAAIALAACATQPAVSSTPARTSTPQSASDQGAAVYPNMKRWTGSLNPTRSYNGGAVASERQNARGRVEMTVSPNAPTLSRVILTVTVPNEPGLDAVGWGVIQGRCGSGNPTVLSPSNFPPIPIGANGGGKVDVKIPFVIPDNGNYHVDVFRGSGNQLSDVLTCGELRPES
jgi:hypothetical protein